MRVNKLAPGYLLPGTTTLTKDMLRMSGVGKLGKGNYATPRAPDVTPPNTYVSPDRTPYRTGDGDYFHAPQRQGADHSYIKSRGFAC